MAQISKHISQSRSWRLQPLIKLLHQFDRNKYGVFQTFLVLANEFTYLSSQIQLQPVLKI